MQTVKRSALVPYSAEEMYALVADIPRYNQFLKWCRGAKILSEEDRLILASITIDYKGLHKTFTTRNLMDPHRSITINLVEGPFSHLRGVWLFDALDAQASRIELDMVFDLKSWLVGSLLSRVFTHIADSQVDAFHQRARELYGNR